jgi:hypothetical protein
MSIARDTLFSDNYMSGTAKRQRGFGCRAHIAASQRNLMARALFHSTGKVDAVSPTRGHGRYSKQSNAPFRRPASIHFI